MLKNSFYKITAEGETLEGKRTATITFDKSHAIFEGHFPSLPIVPGVCMVAIVKELLEEKVKRELHLKEAAALKFLSLINPEENDTVDVTVTWKNNDDGSINADGVISFNNITFFKITRAVYR